MLQLGLRGARVVAEDFDGVADVGVDADGRIAAIGEVGEATEDIDLTGAILLPGAFDAHTHIRAPGYPEREDAESGTLSALLGGVTAVAEMPMADVGTRTAERVRERQALFAEHGYVDVGLFGAGGQDALPEIPAMADAGVLGFKSFLRPAYTNRAQSFEGATVETEDGLDRVTRAIAATGLPWLVHAENVHLKAAARPADGVGDSAALPVADHVTAETWAEVAGIRAAIAYARAVGARLHVVHVSAAASLREIGAAQPDVDITAEACLPQLAFVAGDEERYGRLARVSPAAKLPSDQAALWRGIESGLVATVASDHAPFSPAECEEVLDGRAAGPLGMPGLQHLLPLSLTLAHDHGVSLRAVVAALTARPARRFGVWPHKGSISVGADADLVVVDTSAPGRIANADLVSKCTYTPLDGWPLRYRVHGVITHGRVARWDGETRAEPGWGRTLRRHVPAAMA